MQIHDNSYRNILLSLDIKYYIIFYCIVFCYATPWHYCDWNISSISHTNIFTLLLKLENAYRYLKSLQLLTFVVDIEFITCII